MDYVDQWIAELAAHNFEGRTRWLIRDSVGLATFATGNMVRDVAACRMHPWKRQNGQLATAAEVQADYARVMAMPADRLPHFYLCPSSLMVDDTYVTTLLRLRGDGFDAQLQALFPSFASWPVDGKIPTLDMAFNLGVGRADTSTSKATGLHEFTKLLFALAQTPPDFNRAAMYSARNVMQPAFKTRNDWTREKYLKAAQERA